jgi:hypothetical protein
MTTRTSRTLEELVELQDKAITALETALKATQIALEALQKARVEQGTPLKFEWTPLPVPLPPTYPYPMPITGGTWGTNQTLTGVETKVTSAVVDQFWDTAMAALSNTEAEGKYAFQSQGNYSVSEGGNI